MDSEDKRTETGGGNRFWNFIDRIEGDKVVWIIVIMLILISALAIFSSTSALTGDSKSRVDMLKTHSLYIGIGLGLIYLLYSIRSIKVFRILSQAGFLLSLGLLIIMDTGIDLGFVRPANYNDATRTLLIFNKFQFHVFEFVKVAMVMYLAWALHSYQQDLECMNSGKKSTVFKWANALARHQKLKFLKNPIWKRILYLYVPVALITALSKPGSNSSMIFIGAVSLVMLWIGRMPKRELCIMVGAAALGLGALIGLYKISDGKIGAGMRIDTMIARVTDDYSIERLIEIENDKNLGKKSPEWYKCRDKIKQPYTAYIAVHQGGIIGEGSGNSTQKYIVAHIYSDYMFSFLVEEYGMLGGILIIFLFLSLLARGSMIAKMCQNDFAKLAVGGLTFMITAQAFMHIMVNVDMGVMTGQTLPLISDGRFAFLMFCIAFGIILSISRMANNQIKAAEAEANPLTTDSK